MLGLNDGRRYLAESEHTVKKQSTGEFFEEITWKRIVRDGKEIDLSKLSDFRQILSLDENFISPLPNLAQIPAEILPYLVGPIFDLMTFYVDTNPILFREKLSDIEKGLSVYIPFSKPASWADGSRVLMGEDCIDFNVSLSGTDSLFALRVEHVGPPLKTCVSLPETWMASPLKSRPNNWVQVTKSLDEHFVVQWGYEYFDTHIYLDPKSGFILSAEMYNPVDIKSRTCREIQSVNGKIISIKECGEISTGHIFRSISIQRF